VDGNAVPHSKPDPTVFQEAARRLGFEPGRCVVVEDAESGVAGAQAAGMRVIGIGPGHRVGAADLVVESIAQIRTSTIRWLVAGT
jgi:kojibiose phosphorylase